MLWAELRAKRCHLRLHGAFVPLSVIHLLLGETLQQACHQAHWHQSALHVAVWHNTAGVALWPGGKSGSIAVAALALITAHTNSLQLTVGWCWQRDPGLHLKHIVSQCGGGDAHRWKTLFTDGPLKKPTAAKQRSRWAVWGVEAIMGCDCLAHGHWLYLKAFGQMSLIFFFSSVYFTFLCRSYPQNCEKCTSLCWPCVCWNRLFFSFSSFFIVSIFQLSFSLYCVAFLGAVWQQITS